MVATMLCEGSSSTRGYYLWLSPTSESSSSRGYYLWLSPSIEVIVNMLGSVVATVSVGYNCARRCGNYLVIRGVVIVLGNVVTTVSL